MQSWAVTKIACLFNHKAGVSKTKIAVTLGCMRTPEGKKVILADCDAQCNLTDMVKDI